ncbi:FtsX-like permease family protein [Corynebacterium doosanense]|uniref:ABC3 transporter permease C-terminal domain-containing protein n=1 Tax=Corynebacterium doosanense CAU 212 = DSM 45436 TaxID=558173 RepID=A0A097IJF2_9CORY|nr:FtsX-like permease family protein [Corynebacterium doosanense]AIT62245.1 hypothetical protein CDOO_04695 [Corynebacterium doosanense CAU 212 = DSM 45436]
MELNAGTAYRRELKTTARPYIAGLIVAATIIGTLLGTILYVGFSPGGSDDLAQGMVNTSLIAIFPTLAGVRLAHQNFIADHRSTIVALKNLGVSNAFFRRHFLAQALALAALASIAAVVIGRIILRPFLGVLLWGMGKTLPDQYGSPLRVLFVSFIALGAIYLIGVGTIRLESALNKHSDAPTVKGSRTKVLTAVGLLLALVNIGCGLWSLAGHGSNTTVAIMILTSPVLAAVSAGPLSRLLARLISTVLSRISGWSAPALGIRSISATGTISRAGLAAVLVSIPLAGFTWVSSSLAAGSFYAEQLVSNVPVIVSEDSQLLTPDQAEDVCSEIGDSCRGVIYWQPSDIAESGAESVPRNRANDYTLAGSTPQIVEEFVPGDPTPAGSNPFHLEYMQIAAAVSKGAPVDPDWALVVADSTPGLKDSYTVVSSRQWAETSGRDTQLFYGPGGDGTSGFIPLAAYTLLATCVVLIVATIGKRSSLRRFFSPLALLGKSPLGIQATSFWTVLFPYLTATVAAVLASAWYGAVAHTVTTGKAGVWMPFMPSGLWVLFGLVFLATSATSFLPDPERKRQVGNEQEEQAPQTLPG